MKLSTQDVVHIASLAKLKLTNKEIEKFKKELSETIDYINKLNEIDTSKVEPMSHVTGLKNVYREDIEKLALTQKSVLSQTRKSHNGYFEVDIVLDKT